MTFEEMDDMGGMEAPSMFGGSIYGGLKYFISEKTAIGPMMAYRIQTVDMGEASGTSKSLVTMVSLSTLF